MPHCEFCFAFTDYCGSTKQQAIQNIENVTKSFPDNQPVKDNTAEEGKDRNVSKAQKVIDSENAELYGKVSVIVPPSSMTNTIGACEENVSSGNMKIIHPLFSKPKLQQTEKMNNPVNYIRYST